MNNAKIIQINEKVFKDNSNIKKFLIKQNQIVLKLIT